MGSLLTRKLDTTPSLQRCNLPGPCLLPSPPNICNLLVYIPALPLFHIASFLHDNLEICKGDKLRRWVGPGDLYPDVQLYTRLSC